jgi:hypothetical protein
MLSDSATVTALGHDMVHPEQPMRTSHPIAGLLWVILLAGCQGPAPTTNRYAPAFRSGPVLESADDLVQTAHDALDTIDAALENALY